MAHFQNELQLHTQLQSTARRVHICRDARYKSTFHIQNRHYLFIRHDQLQLAQEPIYKSENSVNFSIRLYLIEYTKKTI